MAADGFGDERDVADGVGDEDDDDDAHAEGEDRVDAAGGLDAAQVEASEDEDEGYGPGGVRDLREDVLRGGAAPDRTDDGIEHVVHQHGPADDVAGERMDFFADVGVSGPGAGIDAGHPAIANGGEEHRDHGDEDGGDDVATRGVADDAVNAHGRGGLNDDDAVEDEVVKLERAAEAGCVRVGRGRGFHACPLWLSVLLRAREVEFTLGVSFRRGRSGC